MLPAPDVAFLVFAGVLAGVIGAAGAITSLISYPALLVVGIPPLAAGVANIVAVTTLWPGSALTSGPELAGRGAWLRWRVPVAALGGLIGAALLLSTSSGAFVRIVPGFVAGGSLVLLASPRLTARRAVAGRGEPRGMTAAILLMSVYGSYFGAGSGVIMLSLCLVCVDDALPAANALKNMLIGASTLAGALTLIVFGHVRWDAVVPLGIGVFVGATLGPPVARRVPARVLRPLVATFGIGLAIQLWLSHGA